MFSQKTKYGLKAVLCLAKHYHTGSVLITDIARQEDIPQKFLEAILLELKKRDVLQSKKGKGGGYSLARLPQEIMLGEIFRVLEGSILPDARGANPSEIDLVIREVKNAVSNILDKTSLADLMEKARKNQNVLNYVI